MQITFEPVWFDSFGAKSSCILIRTADVSILIDPGAAIMQPSFPASFAKKVYWLEKAKAAIRKAGRKATVTVVTHYHYDHFTRAPEFYKGKTLLAKTPNEYINDSQRKRAETFFQSLWKFFENKELEGLLEKSTVKAYPNPLESLKDSMKVDFGGYAERRRELLNKGLEWFKRRVKNWNSWRKIPELESEKLTIRFADGKKFNFGKTLVKFTKPLFHGIEFSRVGWVISVTIEHKGKKLLYSSDLNGPIIEDYASWIIRENPDILVLDGPMTYMFGYLLNRTNLNRVIKNVCRIINETDTQLIIFDHHLPREPKFKQRLSKVYELAKETDKRILTAAEYLNKKPKVLEAVASKL
jgi:hypothetical protein